jgi:phosphoglycerol transferase MdoB-like AlkP superfamily enzyme
MGFGRFWDLHDMGIKPSGWGASDADVRIFLQQTLRKQQGRFYFHWITMTSHGPYTLVRQLYQEPRFAAIEPEAVRDYLTSMAYVDQQLAALVTSFKAQHPDAYLVIYGDHTSSLQHGFTPSTLQHDGHRLEFVPLFIVTPDQQVRRENQRVASFLDLSVSIMGAAGVAYSLHSFGCDVLQPLTMEQVRYQGGWLDRRQLYQDMEAKRPHRLEHDH